MKASVFKSLTNYDTYLTTAHKADFIRALTTTQLNDLIAIGAELGIHYKNNNCPKCVLEFIKKLAVPYFEHKKNLEKKSAPKVDEQLPQVEASEKA